MNARARRPLRTSPPCLISTIISGVPLLFLCASVAEGSMAPNNCVGYRPESELTRPVPPLEVLTFSCKYYTQENITCKLAVQGSVGGKAVVSASELFAGDSRFIMARENANDREAYFAVQNRGGDFLVTNRESCRLEKNISLYNSGFCTVTEDLRTAVCTLFVALVTPGGLTHQLAVKTTRVTAFVDLPHILPVFAMASGFVMSVSLLLIGFDLQWAQIVKSAKVVDGGGVLDTSRACLAVNHSFSCYLLPGIEKGLHRFVVAATFEDRGCAATAENLCGTVQFTREVYIDNPRFQQPCEQWLVFSPCPPGKIYFADVIGALPFSVGTSTPQNFTKPRLELRSNDTALGTYNPVDDQVVCDREGLLLPNQHANCKLFLNRVYDSNPVRFKEFFASPFLLRWVNDGLVDGGAGRHGEAQAEEEEVIAGLGTYRYSANSEAHRVDSGSRRAGARLLVGAALGLALLSGV